MKVRDEVVDGQKFEIFVESDGKFSVHLPDGNQALKADSMQTLVTKLRNAVRGANLPPVPATIFTGASRYSGDRLGFEDVIVTGIHAGNQNVLYRKAGTTYAAQQFHGYGDCYMLKRLTKEEKEKLKELDKAQHDAEAAFEKYRDSLKLDVKAALEARKEKEK